jgi:hypothetical protein
MLKKRLRWFFMGCLVGGPAVLYAETLRDRSDTQEPREKEDYLEEDEDAQQVLDVVQGDMKGGSAEDGKAENNAYGHGIL